MRLHLQALTLLGVAVDTYTWSADQGTFYDGYGLGAVELTGAALTGAALTDVYWEGTAQPALNATLTLTLNLTGNPTPVVLTRTIRSRVMQGIPKPYMAGDDVRMLQAVLRTIGISQGSFFGWRGTPVDIDGSFGPGTVTAVNTFRAADQIGQTGTIEQEALTHLQEHWQDYLAAFEAYPTEPIINMLVPDPATHFEVWLNAGATKLGETLTDASMAQISPTVTRKDILRAWVTKEADAGHWGYKDNWTATRKVPYRIVLGGYDDNGSIGFSQIQNRFKYGEDNKVDELNPVNLYHPVDGVKGFAIFSNNPAIGGGFYYAFSRNEHLCSDDYKTYTCQKTYGATEFPQIDVANNSYTDQLSDRLVKGLGAYHRGASVGGNIFSKAIWPEILRNYSPDNGGLVQEAIRYALEVKQQAGLSLESQKWTWKVNATQSFEYSEHDWFSGTSWEEKKNQALP